MAKNTFVILAHKYNPKKHQIGGWYASEKLDGQRAYWVPETRGLKKKEVAERGLLSLVGKENPNHISTGLWSRLGNVIHAPSAWVDRLPSCRQLDGELFAIGKYRQDLRSIISRYEPDQRWGVVGYNIFDCPSYGACFHDTYQWLLNYDIWDDLIRLHPQERLPQATDAAVKRMEEMLDTVVSNGGEGLILRNPWSYWEPHRSHNLLKVKPCDDDEGIVIGYTAGRATDKGSKLLGKMGALILRLNNGKTLELSGFTEAERALGITKKSHFVDRRSDQDARDWAADNPGQELPEWAECMLFPRGTSVTFKYRGLTKDGIPSEARYWRKEWK